MKYQLVIKGEFTNIKGMVADLTFPAILTCSSCGTTHDKVVILSEESKKTEKYVYKCNFEMHCHSCKTEMRINIKYPEKMAKREIKDYYGDLIEVEYNPVGVEGCPVAIFETNGAIVEEIKDVTLHILTEDDKWFDNNHSDSSRTLTGEYPPNKIFSIVKYENELKRIK